MENAETAAHDSVEATMPYTTTPNSSEGCEASMERIRINYFSRTRRAGEDEIDWEGIGMKLAGGSKTFDGTAATARKPVAGCN